MKDEHCCTVSYPAHNHCSECGERVPIPWSECNQPGCPTERCQFHGDLKVLRRNVKTDELATTCLKCDLENSGAEGRNAE